MPTEKRMNVFGTNIDVDVIVQCWCYFCSSAQGIDAGYCLAYYCYCCFGLNQSWSWKVRENAISMVLSLSPLTLSLSPPCPQHKICRGNCSGDWCGTAFVVVYCSRVLPCLTVPSLFSSSPAFYQFLLCFRCLLCHSHDQSGEHQSMTPWGSAQVDHPEIIIQCLASYGLGVCFICLDSNAGEDAIWDELVVHCSIQFSLFCGGLIDTYYYI